MLVFEKIYQAAREIPAGQVSTYGAIAKRVGTTPRVVGFALHVNSDRNTPCHRVVFKDGSLAKNYAFGGEKEQEMRLRAEGVKFIGNHVDLGSAAN